MTAEVSGLPSPDGASTPAFQKVRDQFKAFFSADPINHFQPPGARYVKFPTPIPVTITGPVFFDVDHKPGEDPHGEHRAQDGLGDPPRQRHRVRALNLDPLSPPPAAGYDGGVRPRRRPGGVPAMLRVTAGGRRLCDGFTRREVLRLGGAGVVGLALPAWLRAEALAPASRVKSVVLFFLEGGPAHQDLWDMKPDAPEGVRGEFRPIATTVPGLSFCEHLPMLAKQAHHLALVR